MGKYLVRKFVLNQQGEELRHEDYPDRFETPEAAQVFLASKEEKYRQTLEDEVNDGTPLSEIPERRRYEVVRLNK